MNALMIWPYDVMNEKMYITFGHTLANRLVALAVTSFVVTSVGIVFDNLKTRL